MNYKVLPLFAILVLMVLPVSNVYALHTTEVTIDNGGSFEIIAIGNNEFMGTPTGTVGTDNGHFIAYIVQDDDGDFDKTIFFTSSTDGVTYTEPLNVTSTLDGFGYNIFNLAIFEDSGTIDMLWQEEDGGGGNPSDIRHIRSTNGGTSFGSVNTVISTAVGFGNADSMWYSVKGNTISVVYENGDTTELEFTKSTTGGTLFSSPVTVDDGLSTGVDPTGNFRNVVIESNSATTIYWVVYTATQSTDGTFDVYTQYSNDGGATWTSPINHSGFQSTQGGIGFQTHLFISGTNVTAIYSGQGGGGTTYLSLVRSLNNGVTYFAQQDIELGVVCDWIISDSHVVTQKDGGSTIHAMCTGDSPVVVRQGMQTAKSTDSGATWTSFKEIANSPTSTVSSPIVVKASGDLVTYTWNNLSADRNTYRSSEDGGSTLNAESNFREDSTANFINMVHSGFDVFIAGLHNLVLKSWFESFIPPDTDIPVITIVGDDPLILNLFAEFNVFDFATCLDPTQGDVTGNIGQDHDVNTSIAGEYQIEYECDDGVGNFAIPVFLDVIVVSDTTPPVISTTTPQPILLMQNGSFDAFAFVQCIDNLDGEIVPNGNFATDGGITIDTSNYGLQTQDYDCEDSVSNIGQSTVEYLIKRESTGGGSSGTTSLGSSITSGGVQDIATSVPPALPIPTAPSPITTDIPTLSVTDQLQGESQFLSFFDRLADLFGNRLDAETGEVVDGVVTPAVQQRVDEIRAEQVPEGVAERPNVISDFFSNFFRNIFG